MRLKSCRTCAHWVASRTAKGYCRPNAMDTLDLMQCSTFAYRETAAEFVTRQPFGGSGGGGGEPPVDLTPRPPPGPRGITREVVVGVLPTLRHLPRPRDGDAD